MDITTIDDDSFIASFVYESDKFDEPVAVIEFIIRGDAIVENGVALSEDGSGNGTVEIGIPFSEAKKMLDDFVVNNENLKGFMRIYGEDSDIYDIKGSIYLSVIKEVNSIARNKK